ncbi:MAG: tyrosine-type recombinase/integrase [Deltaproteobacteria bacterium]|jgi:integrase|nr:tyrosine-type recombinase/integrase [Deltaproteobacteria bacterium]
MAGPKKAKKPLTEARLKALKSKDKPFKVTASQGLYVYVTPAGRKIWRVNYRFQGKQQTLTFGHYPELGLDEAKGLLAEVKKALRSGLNPANNKSSFQRPQISVDNSFEAVANEFLEIHRHGHRESYVQSIKESLTNHIFPYIGARPIDKIDPPELLAALRRTESQGKLNTTSKLKIFVGLVFRYAIATGKAQRDASADLKGALKLITPKHYPNLTKSADLRRLLLAIDSFSGYPVVKIALQLSPLLFVRPGELRQAEWAELDLVKSEWRIPAEKMKMKRPHIVPLSRQSLALIERLRPYSQNSRFLFPSPRDKNKPINPGHLLYALRSMGFKADEIVPHGFRSIASTLLNEQGYNRDWIERQLAHVPGGVRAAYNYAEYLKERRRMIQDWADYLDKVKAGDG